MTKSLDHHGILPTYLLCINGVLNIINIPNNFIIHHVLKTDSKYDQIIIDRDSCNFAQHRNYLGMIVHGKHTEKKCKKCTLLKHNCVLGNVSFNISYKMMVMKNDLCIHIIFKYSYLSFLII